MQKTRIMRDRPQRSSSRKDLEQLVPRPSGLVCRILPLKLQKEQTCRHFLLWKTFFSVRAAASHTVQDQEQERKKQKRRQEKKERYCCLRTGYQHDIAAGIYSRIFSANRCCNNFIGSR